MNSSSDLPKPWKYKNKWVVWPETVPDIITIADCNDTVKGICLSGKTIQECIDECKESCTLGYYIKFENGSTLCTSIRTDIHPYLNPIHRLKKKSIYPSLSNIKISTFINTDFFSWPPEEANVVFFQDVLSISDSVNGNFVKAGSHKNLIQDDTNIYLDSNEQHNLQFVQSIVTSAQVSKYIPLRYGIEFLISTPSTSLLLVVTYENKLVWKSISSIFYTRETSFSLIPLDSTKKNDDIVTYDDFFAISYLNSSSLVVVNIETNSLILVNDNIDNILNNNKLISKFTLKSKMIGYYCDGRNCKPIPIKDMKTFGNAGRYKNVTVGRDPSCWGVCKYLKLGTNSQNELSTTPPNEVFSKSKSKINILFIILSMIIIFILCIIIIRKYKTN